MRASFIRVPLILFLFSTTAFSQNYEVITLPKPTDVSGEAIPKLEEARRYIRHKQAVDKYGVLGRGLTVAIVDTGIYTGHQDLEGRIVQSLDFVGSGTTEDEHGHGTHVAGIVGANGVNKGIAQECNFVSLKVSGKDGGVSIPSVAQSLRWIQDHHEEFNISVANLSLGTATNLTSFSDYSDPIAASIAALSESGVCVVISAGNSYWSFQAEGMCYPAIIPEAISVGAIFDGNIGTRTYGNAVALKTEFGQITPFSQRLLNVDPSGRFCTDVFAPGASVTSTGINGPISLSIQNGTSQAAPVVSGVVLMMQQLYFQKYRRLPETRRVKQWLRESSLTSTDREEGPEELIDNVKNSGSEYRLLDAKSALDFMVRDLN